ncbi:MAG: DUF1491 family protein [Hyphomicrobiaceae bacterium]
MRLKADIWIRAYLRTVARHGAFGAVVAHGDDDAGALYIKVSRLDGTARLFGPAPAGLETADGDRAFAAVSGDGFRPEGEIDAALARERDFDPDLWIVEVEDREGRDFLGSWLVP